MTTAPTPRIAESPTPNVRTVLAYVAALNAGDMDAVRPLFTPDAAIHGVTGSGDIDAAIAIWRSLRGGLNMRLTVEDLAESPDAVVVRFCESGCWTGPCLGWENPTGRTYQMPAIEWFSMRDGVIHRRWGIRDSGMLARQIGLVPDTDKAAA
jgi:ketosteroid isomerase-like protein